MDTLDCLRAFVATAQARSFTVAAERLGLSSRLTSKYVAELEARLGTRVLQRTTRTVGLTPAGEELLARAPALLDDFAELLASVSSGERSLAGTLRVSAPVTFGEVWVGELLHRFAGLHPELTVDLRLDDAHVDLAAHGIDVAFRIGRIEDSALKARRILAVESLTVAAPDYLARHGAPTHPAELARHDCIIDTNRRASHRWRYQRGDESFAVDVRGRFMVNSARIACDLAVAGAGIAVCPAFVLGDALASGRLVRIFPDHVAPAFPLSAVYLQGNTLSRKVRALIDFAVAAARAPDAPPAG